MSDLGDLVIMQLRLRKLHIYRLLQGDLPGYLSARTICQDRDQDQGDVTQLNNLVSGLVEREATRRKDLNL